MERDGQTIRVYAEEHVDVWSSLEMAEQPAAHVIVGFTSDLEEHCKNLRELVVDPDGFELVQGRVSVGERRAVAGEVGALIGDRGSASALEVGDQVEVRLDASPDAAALAGDLLDRFGDAISVNVGGQPYLQPSGCRSVVVEDVPLEATVDLDEAAFGVGEEITGTVTLTNTSDESLFVEPQVDNQPLVVAGTDSEFVYWDQETLDVGTEPFELASGDSRQLHFRTGPAACGPGQGPVVQSGAYDVEAVIRVRVSPTGAASSFQAYQFVSAPFTLSISDE